MQSGAGAFVGKRLLCAFDYHEAGKDPGEQHAAGYWQPEKVALLEERLSLKVYRDQQGLNYELGPKPMRKLEGVKLELARIAKLPECMIPGPDGKPVRMPVELEALPGVSVKDLAEAWDAATAAGFTVELCSQTDAARQIEEPPPPPPPPVPQRKQGEDE